MYGTAGRFVGIMLAGKESVYGRDNSCVRGFSGSLGLESGDGTAGQCSSVSMRIVTNL